MTVLQGDCLEVMQTLDAGSVDAIVCDPPYGLSFMGKAWDHGVPGIPFWSAALRVAKPGSYLLAFGGTRTYHRLTCAIEDAGWEIRDCLSWLYGSGFPKSLDVSKAIDKAAGAEREITGIDEQRRSRAGNERYEADASGSWANEGGTRNRSNPESRYTLTAPATDAAKEWQGWGTALKPAWEPIILARKPLTGTVASNVQAHGTGALNIDGCRLGDGSDRTQGGTSGGSHTFGQLHRIGVERPTGGRWPANVCLDEWEEQVLYLRDNIPAEVATLIREFFRDYRRVPAVSLTDRDVPEPQGTDEVLRARVLGGVAEREAARRSAPDARQEALTGIVGEDARAETSDGEARAGSAGMEGRALSEPGLRDDSAAEPPSGAGASASDGEDARAEAPALRGGASPERREVGQPAGELGAPRQRHAQAHAPVDHPRVTRVASRERTLAILACDVPAGWRAYFRDSGLVVRSPDSAAALLDAQSGERTTGIGGGGRVNSGATFGAYGGRPDPTAGYGDTGGASRFFYTAKASRRERGEGNDHPTVKPLALMRWLCRLVTRPDGLILDPFTGSGSTGCAAVLEGFRFLGIEKEEQYAEIARARIAHHTPAQLSMEVA